MRNISSLTLPVCALGLIVGASAAEAACTPTGFIRDSINLTAAMINPHGTVTGDVDATGCNIGIYYSTGHGRVTLANVHGANYFGIVNNGADVDISLSNISDIGEKPFNGTQHGVGIYFAFGASSRGDIRGNIVTNYQKGGIVVNGNTGTTDITNNTVIGLGPVNFIAQNGIQAGYGANTNIKNNFVSGNSYTGANLAASGGILVVGGACYGGNATVNTDVDNNIGVNNDVGVWFTNLDASCNPVSTPTKNTADGNVLINNELNNKTGNGPTQGYQAGIADQGDFDVIKNNSTCGPGYTPPGDATIAIFAIDTTLTNNPKLQHNVTCQTGSSPHWHATARSVSAGRKHQAHPSK
ncbi:MAG TPA: hypothetical protein VHD14_04735 [Pseudolabrys sp.]|nr:hypothetical protein [Pseudolabrys sp.]